MTLLEQCLSISKICSVSILSYCLFLLNLFKSLKGKSDAFNLGYLRIAASTRFLSGCYQLSKHLDRSSFCYQHYEILDYENEMDREGVTRARTTKAKSLFMLIKETTTATLPIVPSVSSY